MNGHLRLATGMALMTLFVNAATAAEVRLKTPEGTAFGIYAAGPVDARAGVILLHDWFGVTDMTREAIDRLGDLGYRAVAVDLYGGESAGTHEGAQKLMGALGARDRAEVDAILRTTVDYLAGRDRRIATMGFSMGGALALRTHLLDPEAISATVVVYGGGLENRSAEELKTLNGPLLMVTGTKDQWALDSTLAMVKKLESLQKAAEVYIYPGADHGFAQPLYAGGDNLDPTATRVSWMVIEDFLKRVLG